MPKEGEHSIEVIGLVKEFIERIQNIKDTGAECFPFYIIEELLEEDFV